MDRTTRSRKDVTTMVKKHAGNARHVEAVRLRNAQRGPAARRTRAAERIVRTPSDQLAALDSRLGVGIGAQSERDRLSLRITA